jgi:hypothetical protein
MKFGRVSVKIGRRCDQVKTVQIDGNAPGKLAADGEFVFELQPRSNGARVVRFSLKAQDAESIKKAVEAYLKELK